MRDKTTENRGASTSVQLSASAAGAVVADKTIPKAGADQFSKQLYYKYEQFK